eukprot:gene19258-21186_t
MSSGGTPYIGSKISLVSKAKIRYEGFLYTIDTDESTVTLAKVKSFGTEDRSVENRVPERNEIFEYIVFRGSDIDDLHVSAGPKSRSSQVAQDPAILQTGTTQPNMYQPQPQMPMQMGGHFPHQSYGPFGGIPTFGYPLGFRPSPGMPLSSVMGQSGERNQRTSPFDRHYGRSPSPPSSNAMGPRQSQRDMAEKRDMSPEADQQADERPCGGQTEAPKPQRLNRGWSHKDTSEQQQQKGHGERFVQKEQEHASTRKQNNEQQKAAKHHHKDNESRSKSNTDQSKDPKHRDQTHARNAKRNVEHKDAEVPGNARSNDRGAKNTAKDTGHKASGQRRKASMDKDESEENRPHASSSSERGRGRGKARGVRGRGRGFYNRTKFDQDFDFESSNAKFNKEEVEKELLSSLKKNLSMKDEDEDVIVEKEAGKGSPDNNDVNGDSDEYYYDKEKSFFDQISCDSGKERPDMQSKRKERSLNAETFGIVPRNYRGRPYRGRGGRGGYRGRGYTRGSRGRRPQGGENRAWVDYEFDFEAAGLRKGSSTNKHGAKKHRVKDLIVQIMADERDFDLCVFGASGFTGKHVALELAKCCKDRPWAIAGRSKEKLANILEWLESETGCNLSDVGTIIADTSDEKSLFTMCARTKVVLACVGPFRFFGEPVVKACVKAKTNYVDVSGEPEFLETAQLRYNKEAEEAGIHIVGACGFDSIPADCGIEYLREQFLGELTAVESYIKYHGNPKVNFGTYESMIYGVQSSGNLKDLRKQLMPNRLNYVGPKLKKRGVVFHSKQENQWSVLFMGADPSIVRRTQYHLEQKFKQTPIQYSAYFCFQSFFQLVIVMLMSLFLGILAPFECGRSLLKKYPKFFTFGIFSREGATKQAMTENTFSVNFYGTGYSSGADRNAKPDKALGLKIVGPEPGYVATPIFQVQAALTILDDKLKNKGGVLTPGAAFKGSSLIDRLKTAAILILLCVLCFLDWIVRGISIKSKLKLANSHVLITGGSSGIGLATAGLFLAKGANVTLVARNKMKLAQAIMSLEKFKLKESQKICIVSTDLRKDFNAVSSSIEEARECIGPVDILINCAGYAISSTFQDTDPEDFKALMDTNYLGAVLVTKCIVNDMIARKSGHIAFVSSIGGQMGLYGYAAYSASKFALRGLAETLYSELKPYNIGVSIVFPPDTDTPGFENENQSKPEATKLISETAGLFPPEKVAEVIINGIVNRQYLICCGTDGFAVNTLTCGGAPPSSLCELLIQIFLMGPLKLIMTFYLWNFDRIIKKCSQSGNRGESKKTQ